MRARAGCQAVHNGEQAGRKDNEPAHRDVLLINTDGKMFR